MAPHRVKTTHALDVETERSLDDLAGGRTPIQSLDQVQRALALTPRRAARWVAATRAERNARSRRQEARSR